MHASPVSSSSLIARYRVNLEDKRLLIWDFWGTGVYDLEEEGGSRMHWRYI